MGTLAAETVFVHIEKNEICHVRFLKYALSLVLDLKLRSVHNQSRIPRGDTSPVYWPAGGA